MPFKNDITKTMKPKRFKTGCYINVRTYVKSCNSCIEIEVYQLSILEELGQNYSSYILNNNPNYTLFGKFEKLL